MQSKESRERRIAVVATTHDDLLDLRAEKGHQHHQIGRHVRRPESFLIPGQQVAGQCQSEHDLHQDQAQPKVDFPRCFVGMVNHHLTQV